VTETPRNALIVVAHPDDAEFLCGGTVARWASEGCEVNYVLSTSGDMGTHDEGMTRERLAAIREREQRAAAKVLGVRECVFLGWPDGFVEDTRELRGQIVLQIRRFQPDVLLTWDPYRRSFTHRDHRLTGQAAVDAAFPLARDILAYPEQLTDGLKPHRVSEVFLAGSDEPDHHVDVGDYFQKKIQALRRHKSQLGAYPLKELRKRLRERMTEAAKGSEYKLAERFRRIKWR
jgi:LmbE family N-acetylglucosaminyl deacetylase